MIETRERVQTIMRPQTKAYQHNFDRRGLNFSRPRIHTRGSQAHAISGRTSIPLRESAIGYAKFRSLSHRVYDADRQRDRDARVIQAIGAAVAQRR